VNICSCCQAKIYIADEIKYPDTILNDEQKRIIKNLTAIAVSAINEARHVAYGWKVNPVYMFLYLAKIIP